VKTKTERAENRNRKGYSKAWFDNDFHMSNGGHGIDPWPSFEEWMELGGYIMPGWREDLKKRRAAVPEGGVLTLPAGVSMPVKDSPVGDLVSDIAAEIAAEEHRQGLPVGKNREHCDSCCLSWEERALRRRQEFCRHEFVDHDEIRVWGGKKIVYRARCSDCDKALPTWDFVMEMIRG